ncbi:MAG: hypothetical protein GY943_14420 [Chloroflexi bacterium]|nr:hypothetical protein [Chloroflexota bacterium]
MRCDALQKRVAPFWGVGGEKERCAGEVGLGIVPEFSRSRLYRDIIGRANQQLAAAADCVIVMSAGIPQVIKGMLLD